jgi:alpha/beta superfamily hydrolase
MALQVGVTDERARALFALGYPVRMLDGHAFLDDCTKPRLFVQGDADQFGGDALIRALVEPLPEPKRLVVVPNSDHFFTDRLDALQQAIDAWTATSPWAAT